MNQRRVHTANGTLAPHIYNGSIDCFVKVNDFNIEGIQKKIITSLTLKAPPGYENTPLFLRDYTDDYY